MLIYFHMGVSCRLAVASRSSDQLSRELLPIEPSQPCRWWLCRLTESRVNLSETGWSRILIGTYTGEETDPDREHTARYESDSILGDEGHERGFLPWQIILDTGRNSQYHDEVTWIWSSSFWNTSKGRDMTRLRSWVTWTLKYKSLDLDPENEIWNENLFDG